MTPNAASHDETVQLYVAEVFKFPPLTPDDESHLATAIESGDEGAQRRLIESNLRLVVDIARNYEGRGLPLLDLIQEGNLGLARAVGNYGPGKGGFAAYATSWIEDSIRQALTAQPPPM